MFSKPVASSRTPPLVNCVVNIQKTKVVLFSLSTKNSEIKLHMKKRRLRATILKTCLVKQMVKRLKLGK